MEEGRGGGEGSRLQAVTNTLRHTDKLQKVKETPERSGCDGSRPTPLPVARRQQCGRATGSEARCAEVINRRDRKCFYCGESCGGNLRLLAPASVARCTSCKCKDRETIKQTNSTYKPTKYGRDGSSQQQKQECLGVVLE